MTTPEPLTAARQLSDAIERADWDAVDIWLGTIRATLDAERAKGGKPPLHEYDHDGKHMWWLCHPPCTPASANVDEAREALQAAIVTDATARQVIEAIDAFEAAIRAEAGHKASDHDECGESCEVETLVRSLVARAVRAEAGTLDDWARWIVRQERNPQPGCPECGPLGMDQAPSLCVPHQALARLAGADR